MLKKALVSIMAFSLCVGMAGCSVMNKFNGGNNAYNINPKDILVVTPKGVIPDKSLMNDKVSQLVLPSDYAKDMKSTVDKVTELALDNDVKAVIISSDANGLYEVFKRVKKEKPELLTVGADLNETSTDEGRALVTTSPDISFGFASKQGMEPTVIAKTAYNMGASTLICYSGSGSSRLNGENSAVSDMSDSCSSNGVRFINVRIPEDVRTASAIKRYINDDLRLKISKNSTKIMVTGTSPLINEAVLKNAVEYKYKVPGVFAPEGGNSREAYNKAFDLKLNNDQLNDATVYRRALTKKLKALKIDGNIAGFTRSPRTAAVSLALASAEEILSTGKPISGGYGEAIEQVLNKDEIGLLAARYLNTYFSFERISYGFGYYREIVEYPDIY